MDDVAVENPFSDGDLHEFMRSATQAARMNGACIVEFFTCSACEVQQVASHSFREVLVCQFCDHRNASKVPKLEWPGEVGRHELHTAIRITRRLWPAIDDETRDWIMSQSAAIRAMCAAYACQEVQRALDSVESTARDICGGHVSQKPPKNRKPVQKPAEVYIDEAQEEKEGR